MFFKIGIFLISFCVLFFLVFLQTEGRAQPSIKATFLGHENIVFSSEGNSCSPDDYPDISSRAFKDNKNIIQLYASHFVTRRMQGETLKDLKHVCTPSFSSSFSNEPSEYNYASWISSTYTEDGTKVFALMHNEFHGHKTSLCDFSDYHKCWNNSITSAVSYDGGKNFQLTKPSHLIATLPYRYNGGAGHPTGYFNPTNIIKKDAYYYVMFGAQAYKAQAYGVCLMRTKDLSDPLSWRAWDGKKFSVRFANPYSESVNDAKKHVCEPVGKGILQANQGSLVWHKKSQRFLLVMFSPDPVKKNGPRGLYIASSKNLIEWEAPSLIWKSDLSGSDFIGKSEKLCSGKYFDVYPSIIDESSTRNFETMGEEAWIFFTRIFINTNCQPSHIRHLIKRRIRLSVNLE